MIRALQFLILFLSLQWSCGDLEKYSEKPENNLSKTSKSPNIANDTNEHDEDAEMIKETAREGTKNIDGLKCLSCLAYTSDVIYNYCMNAIKTNFEICVAGQQCFTEFHPFYVKRGCIGHGQINKKFYCNCHLCNDKPSSDIDFYEYDTIRDWTYDNDRLRRPANNDDKICKTCHTGIDAVNDSICLDGKYASFMTCHHDQVCYTNINDITGLVTRGCANAPVFNSIRFNCYKTDCNNRNLLYYMQSQKELLPIMYTYEISSKPKDVVGSVRMKGRGTMWNESQQGKGVRKKKRVGRVQKIHFEDNNINGCEKLCGIKLALESITILLWTLVF